MKRKGEGVVESDKGRESHGEGREWWGEGMREIEGRGRGGKSWRGNRVMEGKGGEGGGRGDGGTDRGEESGGAGLSFRPRAAVFVRKRSFAFVGGRSRWRAVVFVRGRGGGGSCSLGVRGRVLGVRHSCIGGRRPCCRLRSRLLFLGLGCRLRTLVVVWGRGARSRAVYVLHGRGADVLGRWSSYTRGGGRGPSKWGVAAASSWCHDGVSSCYAAPASGCEREVEKGGRSSPEQTRR